MWALGWGGAGAVKNTMKDSRGDVGKMLCALFLPQICFDCCQKSESFCAKGAPGGAEVGRTPGRGSSGRVADVGEQPARETAAEPASLEDHGSQGNRNQDPSFAASTRHALRRWRVFGFCALKNLPPESAPFVTNSQMHQHLLLPVYRIGLPQLPPKILRPPSPGSIEDQLQILS